VSFEIKEGEFVGLIGPNGAGKTTMMKILSGILYPTSGEVAVLGSVPFAKDYRFLKQISFVMGQKNQLIWDLPAMDSFLVNKATYEISNRDFEVRLKELTDLLQCGDLLTHQVRTLSLGQRMKMELIAAVLHHPKVLYLDEPTIGLDVVAQKSVRDFIKEYQQRYKATILLTSHYMEDVKQLAKRVLIINEGKILYDGLLSAVTKKYAESKRIIFILNKQPEEEDLKKIHRQYKLEYPRLVLDVPREKLAFTVERLSRLLSFDDITIEEERIEDVIRKIFQKKRV
jgi:ABC-2 type transport system ATP-binding protein